jgi:hypothetical protein
MTKNDQKMLASGHFVATMRSRILGRQVYFEDHGFRPGSGWSRRAKTRGTRPDCRDFLPGAERMARKRQSSSEDRNTSPRPDIPNPGAPVQQPRSKRTDLNPHSKQRRLPRPDARWSPEDRPAGRRRVSDRQLDDVFAPDDDDPLPDPHDFWIDPDSEHDLD